MIDDLPEDTIFEVFTFLEAKDIANSSLVCRDWRQSSQRQLLWKDFVQKEWIPSSTNNNYDSMLLEESNEETDYQQLYRSRMIQFFMWFRLCNVSPLTLLITLFWPSGLHSITDIPKFIHKQYTEITMDRIVSAVTWMRFLIDCVSVVITACVYASMMNDMRVLIIVPVVLVAIRICYFIEIFYIPLQLLIGVFMAFLSLHITEMHYSKQNMTMVSNLLTYLPLLILLSMLYSLGYVMTFSIFSSCDSDVVKQIHATRMKSGRVRSTLVTLPLVISISILVAIGGVQAISEFMVFVIEIVISILVVMIISAIFGGGGGGVHVNNQGTFAAAMFVILCSALVLFMMVGWYTLLLYVIRRKSRNTSHSFVTERSVTIALFTIFLYLTFRVVQDTLHTIQIKAGHTPAIDFHHRFKFKFSSKDL